MTRLLHIVLEFARAESAGQPHGFRFAAQPYLMRTPGGGFESAEFPWSRALLEDLRALRGAPSAELVHRVGDLLRDFLAGAGWAAREQEIVAAVRAGDPVHITVRSAAAELYALPWELLALKSTGQLLGGIPGLLVRYEWPETTSFPDPIAAQDRRGRVLFAWSAAGGAVPAADHLAGLQAALRGTGFDPTRDVLPHASFAAIADALATARRDGPPIDALHLLCHGAAAGGTYGLALDDDAEPGARVVVDAGRVQQLLAPHAGMLRLVVLAACDSGNVGELGNHLGSVAQMIHRAGLRAVVASRFPLSAAGSARLCAALFAALARQGTSLERAFLAGRDALVHDPSQLDWASVQLYARAADGDTSHPLTHPTPALASPTAPALTTASSPRPARWLALLALAAVALALAMWRPWTAAPVIEPEPEPARVVTEPARVVPAPAPIVTEPAPPMTHTDPPPPKPLETPPTSPVITRPTRPSPQPRKPGACPRELRGYLENGLPAPTAGGARPELRVTIAADGGLGYAAPGGETDYLAQARAKLPRLSDRLIGSHAAALPCTLDLRRP